MSQKMMILEKVCNNKPELYADMERAFNAPFVQERGAHIGKYHRIEKLVDIWTTFKKVPSLVDVGV